MQKAKYFTCVYHSVLFFCSKRGQIKSNKLFLKINNKRELQNIAINHSADIDHKDFVKIHKECTKEPYSFLTTDTTLPASDPLIFHEKNCFILMKMTVTDQLKIIDVKIKANPAQYDLDRLAAISAKSSGELEKYEYLTGEDKDWIGLDKDGQKEGALKRLKILKIKVKSN